MNRLFLWAMLPCILICPFSIAASADDDRFELPKDKNTVVIKLDMHGLCEFGKRKNDEPLLTIRADGSVQVGSPYEQLAKAKGSLSKGELNDLLKFIVRDQHFFELKTDGIKTELKGRQVISRCPEATTSIVVNVGGKRREVKCHALRIAAVRYPDAISAVRMFAVEQRLRRLIGLVQIGGQMELAGWLAHVNEKLTSEHKDLQPLEIDSFHSATKNKHGAIQVTFRRTEKDGKLTSAFVMKTTKKEIVTHVGQETID